MTLETIGKLSWFVGLIFTIFLMWKYDVLKKTYTTLITTYEDTKNHITELQRNVDEVTSNYTVLTLEYETLKTDFIKVVSQKKSSEVRLGKISEQMAPFTEQWPWDPNNFRFLGSPIDGVSFNEDEIVFVEVKTGKSRLSKGQINVKKLIAEGKVRFVSCRIDQNNITFD